MDIMRFFCVILQADGSIDLDAIVGLLGSLSTVRILCYLFQNTSKEFLMKWPCDQKFPYLYI